MIRIMIHSYSCQISTYICNIGMHFPKLFNSNFHRPFKRSTCLRKKLKRSTSIKNLPVHFGSVKLVEFPIVKEFQKRGSGLHQMQLLCFQGLYNHIQRLSCSHLEKKRVEICYLSQFFFSARFRRRKTPYLFFTKYFVFYLSFHIKLTYASTFVQHASDLFRVFLFCLITLMRAISPQNPVFFVG